MMLYESVMVPVWTRGQRLRHVSDGKEGEFSRYDQHRAGWVVVRMRGGYFRVTPATEWDPVEPGFRPRR